MKKLIFFLLLFSLFSFGQINTNFNFDKENSIKKLNIVPFLSSHQAIDISNNDKIDFLAFGGDFNASFSSKLTISSKILKINGNYNNDLLDYIDSLKVFPGMNNADNYISYFSLITNYKINKNFSTRFGRGTNFFGNGYRSMLLSNNHTPYPFFTLVTNFWKIKYFNHFSTFSDIYFSDSPKKKHGAFHYLDYSPNNKLTIGLFEGVIWQVKDENYDRGFDIHYLNPIIFYRPVEFSKHSPDNVLMGINLNYKFKNVEFYGQLLIDDLNITRNENTANGFFQNKLAFQIGVKSQFYINEHNFNFLTEYNQAQPYTYAHKHPLQNYTHMNQALAHPLGANFKENVFILSYSHKAWGVNLKYTYSVYGADSIDTHYGQNIFISDFLASGEGGEFSYGNYNGQGILTHLYNLYTEINYDFNFVKPFIGCAIRKQSYRTNQVFFILGIKTDVLNPFKDF